MFQRNMLASPPPSTDVKPDHRFPSAALAQSQQSHLPAPPRRTSYSLYHHNTHEPSVYPEFNWENASHMKVPSFVHPPRSPNDAMEKRLIDSPQTAGLDPHNRTASASPPSSLSDTVNSDNANPSHEMHHIHPGPSHEEQAEQQSSVSTKRPRPPSLSQLDSRCFGRYPYPLLGVSGHSPPQGLASGAGLEKECEDSSCLPPIVTREERDENGGNESKSVLLIPPPHLERPKSDYADGGVDALDSSSMQRLTDTNQHSLPSSELVSFPTEGYSSSQHNPSHGTPTKSHPTSLSFGAQQSQAPQLTFAAHSNGGYLSALPSPVVTSSHDQAKSAPRSSYPGSPIMTLTTPVSATFPHEQGGAFSSLSPLGSGARSHNLAAPTSPHYPNSATTFPHLAAAHLMGSAYAPNNPSSHGATASTNSPDRVPGACASVSPPNPSSTPPWSSTEAQAPRRRGKLPSAVTGILKTWLMSHTTHPYPTEEEKKSLCEQTNLTMNQVSNWFINARRRILVPPSAGNSVHEVRQPIRRQAQSQLVRAAANAGVAPPCLTIRHLGPPSVPATPAGGLTMFSPVSTTSPHLQSNASFDFRYPLPHQGLSGRPVTSTQYSTPPMRQAPSSPMYSSHGSGNALSYYPSSHSSYSHYSASHSASSTPLPSPHYSASYSGCPTHYSTPQARLASPHPHSDSHPHTPPLTHSSNHRHHSASASYVPQASFNQSISYPTTPDREEGR